jgi:hypothetical protein
VFCYNVLFKYPLQESKENKNWNKFNLCCDCLPNITLPNANLSSEGIAFCLLVMFYIQVAVIYEIYKHVCIYIYVFVCLYIFYVLYTYILEPSYRWPPAYICPYHEFTT